MAEHDVRIQIEEAVIGKKDFKIVVKSSSGGKLGTLLISKGNLE